MAEIIAFPGRTARRQVIRVVKEPTPKFSAETIERNAKACADVLADAIRMCAALLGAAAVAEQLRETAAGLDLIAEREARA